MAPLKLIVTGSYQAGKSSIIKFLDQNAMCVEAIDKRGTRTTVAMDHGHWVSRTGVQVTLFGTPGLMRFRVIREILLQGADGILFVFDAANPAADDNAISILNQVRGKLGLQVPIVYVAHKSDLPDARDPRVVCEQNYLKPCEIFKTSVQEPGSVERAVDALVDKILERYGPHLRILSRFETDIKGLANELNYSKEEIRDYLTTLERKNLITIDRASKKYRVLVNLD
ncbi:MAG: GTP-binding protein [Promethearchaeota archaeon]